MTGPDIGALDTQDELIETDHVSAEDFFQRLAPMDDGDHEVVASLSDRGIEVKPAKTKADGSRQSAFLMVNLTLKETGVDGEAPTKVCFDNPNSVVFVTQAGKRTSRLHVVLDACGEPYEGSSLKELAEHCQRVFSQGPRVAITTRWEAQYEDQSKPQGSKDRYVSIKKGQRNFPALTDAEGNPTGQYNPEITDPKTGKSGIARAQVTAYRRIGA